MAHTTLSTTNTPAAACHPEAAAPRLLPDKLTDLSKQNTAKLFITGRSQALRLSKEFRFPGAEVFIRRDPVTGDVIMSPKPTSWADFFELAERTKIPANFMVDREDQANQERDLF